jgi:hypothetical protein
MVANFQKAGGLVKICLLGSWASYSRFLRSYPVPTSGKLMHLRVIMSGFAVCWLVHRLIFSLLY